MLVIIDYVNLSLNSLLQSAYYFSTPCVLLHENTSSFLGQQAEAIGCFQQDLLISFFFLAHSSRLIVA